MKRYCGCCESSLNGSDDRLTCTVCHGPCCPACAFEFTDATYCSRCAETRSWRPTNGKRVETRARLRRSPSA